MTLAYDDVQSILTGAVRLAEEHSWLAPQRFSPRQLRSFHSSESKLMRALAAAGMTLDFFTDSRSFSMRIRMELAAGIRWWGLDVLVDGELVWHRGEWDQAQAECDVQIALPEGMKRVTVFLPNLYSVRMKDLTLDDGARFMPFSPERRILILGDSIMHGYFSEHPSRSCANLLTRSLRAHCINQAIGGTFFEAADLEPIRDFQPNLIFAAYGTNDWNCSRNIAETARQWFDHLHKGYSGVPVAVLLPIWRRDIAEKEADGRESFSRFRQTLAGICQHDPECFVIDTMDFVPHDGAYFYDHVHPNEAGYAHYAACIEEALKGMNIR